MTTADDYINSVLAQLPHGTPLAAQIELELRAHIAERLGDGHTLDLVLRQLGDPVKLAESYLAAEPLVAPPAGDRILAKIIDALAMMVIVGPLAGFVSYLVPGPPQYAALLVFILLCGSFFLSIATAFVEYASGQTPGKRALGLRVVTESGRRISGGQAIVRQLPILFSVIWIDALFALFTERSQRAFELLSKTRVVVAPRHSQPGRTVMHRAAGMVVVVLCSSPALHAQTVDPSGHWEGTVDVPNNEIRIELDLARNSRGELTGTMNQPAAQISGLPLAAVTLDGRSIRFHSRSDQPFSGVISADGKSISGGYHFQIYSIPFSLTRTGEARVVEPARSAAIGKELEGTWNGTLADRTATRLTLKLANHPDGTATAAIVNLDQGELTLPARVVQAGSTVTIETVAVKSAFTGTLSADGTEIAGTVTQGDSATPLTFRRAAVN
jgi:uncharacterized RDD family membrane protein YckC